MSPNFDISLGTSQINIAHHGVKQHPGIRVDKEHALVLFLHRDRTTASYWNIPQARSLTSVDIPLVLDGLFIEEAEVAAVEAAFASLLPGYSEMLKPTMFMHGYCYEFAVTLKEMRPDLEIALVGAHYPDEDGEPGETYFQATHAVVLDPEDDEFCWDVNGRQRLLNVQISFGPDDHGTLGILREYGSLEDGESYLGSLEPRAQDLAREFITQRAFLFEGLELNCDPRPKV